MAQQQKNTEHMISLLPKMNDTPMSLFCQAPFFFFTLPYINLYYAMLPGKFASATELLLIAQGVIVLRNKMLYETTQKV